MLALPVQTPHTVVGRLEVSDFPSRVLGNARKVRVWLPEGFREGDPVLLMHDGQNLFDGATSFLPGREWRVDESATMLIRAGLVRRVAIVGIDNAGAARGDEYLPRRFRMERGGEIGGRADLYLKMIDEELLPWLAGRYGVATREVGMAGSSLGGIVTLWAARREPGRYTRLGVCSPSVWIDGRAPLGWLRPPAKGGRMWIDVGEREGGSAAGDAGLLAAAARRAGWREGRDLAFASEPNAEHNEDAWARRFPLMLRFLYGR